MITLTILFGVTALVASHFAGITETRFGTGAVTALILFLAISALPQCYWLFDDPAGWLTTLALWTVSTLFYHRLLTDPRRSTPINAGPRRAAIDCRWGGRRFAVAIVWGGA